MTLKRLENSPGWEVKDGDTDIRGWSVYDSTGAQIGKIDGLLFEDTTRRVVYGIVDTNGRNVLVPVGDLDLDESGRRITTRGYDRQRLSTLDAYDESRFDDKAESTYYRNFQSDWKADAHPDYSHKSFAGNDVPQRIRLLEEQLRVGKRETKVGEVVATKKPVTESVTETVELRKERIDIQRHAVNEPVTGEVIGESETIRVPLFAEEAVVDKKAFVKEEVVIDKIAENRTETIREDVRHEELAFAGTEPRIEEEEVVDDVEIQRRGQNIKRTKEDISLRPDRPLGD